MTGAPETSSFVGKEPAWNRIVVDFWVGMAAAVFGGLSCFVGALEILKPDHRTLFLFWGILLSFAAHACSREIGRKLGLVYLKENVVRSAFGPEALRAITDVNRENVITEARRAMFCAWAAMFGCWATLQEIAVAVRAFRQSDSGPGADAWSNVLGVASGVALVATFAVVAVRNARSSRAAASELLVYKL